MSKVVKIYETVKYMNKRQFVYRIKYELIKRSRRKIKQRQAYSVKEDYKFYSDNYINTDFKKDECKLRHIIEIDDIITTANKIINNKFCFLNSLEYQFSEEIQWEYDPFEYRLWNFNLNYFDYLQTLIDAYIFTENISYIEKGYELIDSWTIKCMFKYEKNLWDPYVVSKRLISWIKFFEFNKRKFKKIIDQKYIDAMYTHLKYLSENIEYYLMANHVIMDAKAIIFGAIYFNDKALLDKGIKILREEYKEQVMNDGGHYERSTSYQVEVLEHYLEILMLFKGNGLEDLALEIKEMIRPMYEYLYNITMPNNKIPLLNDSSLEYPIYSNYLLQCGLAIFNESKYKVNKEEIGSFYLFKLFGFKGLEKYNSTISYFNKEVEYIENKDTGYKIIKDWIDDRQIYILFDCGDNGPDYNLGHTHADNLNLILTIGESEILIDKGTYTYQRGIDRNNFRSTQSHNTITVDSLSSSQIWSAFRVAKRAKTRIFIEEINKKYIYISAQHDGYEKILKNEKIKHRRDVIYIKQKCIIIIDVLYGKIQKNHSALLNFNISDFEYQKNYNSIELKLKENEYATIDVKNHDINIEESCISKNFGEKEKSYCLKVQKSFRTNTCIITKIDISKNKISIEEENNDLYIREENKTIKKIII